MHYDENAGNWTFAAGLVIGLALGAGAALLAAPESGKRTRRRLKHAVFEARETASDRLEELGDDMRSAVGTGRRRLRLRL